MSLISTLKKLIDGAAPVFMSDDGVSILGSASNPFQVAVNQSSITGDMAVGGNLTVTGNATITGDVAATGGFRQMIGPFYVTTAASQTDVGTKYGDTVGQTWIAPRAGSITATTGMVDTAVTGAGTSVTVRLFKNGSLVNAALNLAFTQAGAEVAARNTAAKDTYAFAAGDNLKFVYTSTAISNTPKVVANVEIEC